MSKCKECGRELKVDEEYIWVDQGQKSTPYSNHVVCKECFRKRRRF